MTTVNAATAFTQLAEKLRFCPLESNGKHWFSLKHVNTAAAGVDQLPIPEGPLVIVHDGKTINNNKMPAIRYRIVCPGGRADEHRSIYVGNLTDNTPASEVLRKLIEAIRELALPEKSQVYIITKNV